MFVVPPTTEATLESQSQAVALRTTGKNSPESKQNNINRKFKITIAASSSLFTKILLESLLVSRKWLSYSIQNLTKVLGLIFYYSRRTFISFCHSWSILSFSFATTRQFPYLQFTTETHEQTTTRIKATTIQLNHHINTTSFKNPSLWPGMDFYRSIVAQRAASQRPNGTTATTILPSRAGLWDYSRAQLEEGNNTEPRVYDYAGNHQQAFCERQLSAGFQGQQQQHSSGGPKTNEGYALLEAQVVPRSHQQQQEQQQQQQPLHFSQEDEHNPLLQSRTSRHSHSAGRKQQFCPNIENVVGVRQRLQQLRRDNYSEMHLSGKLEDGERLSNDPFEVDKCPPMVLVKKETLSELTEQIAFSMRKMKDLEEQVRVIPELQRRLDNVISDTASTTDYSFIKEASFNNNNDISTSNSNTSTFSGHRRYSDAGDFLHGMNTTFQRRYNSFRFPAQKRYASSAILDHHYHNHHDRMRASLSSSFRNSSPIKQSHLVDLSRSSGNTSSATKLQSSSTQAISSPRVEYEDLINDLLSLSYSVNYLSTTNSTTDSSTGQSLLKSSSDLPGCSEKKHEQPLDQHRRQFSGPAPFTQSCNPLTHAAKANNGTTSGTDASRRDCEANNNAIPNYRLSSTLASESAGCRREQHRQQLQNRNLDNLEGSSQSSLKLIRGRGDLSDSSSALLQQIGASNSGSSQNSRSNLYNFSSPFNSLGVTSSGARSMILEPQSHNQSTYHHSQAKHNNHNNQSSFALSSNQQQSNSSSSSRPSLSHSTRSHQYGSGSLSLQTTPIKTQLDCGCQSFKEHLRYNSISREQRLNNAKSHHSSTTVSSASSSTSSSNNNAGASLSPSPSQKLDASTNTDLSMADIVTRIELKSLVTEIQNTYSNSTFSIASRESIRRQHKSSSVSSDGATTSGSQSGPKSSSQSDSPSDSCEEGDPVSDCEGDVDCEMKIVHDDEADAKENDHPQNGNDRDEEESNSESSNGDEAYSLGSSYLDPSDFEEYLAYGESIDRRTKDFMSGSTKIPNDLRFALIRLNEFLKKKGPIEQLELSSGCIDVIRKEWFKVTATKDSQVKRTKLYVDYLESLTKQLLNTVVNLTDNAGNTAIHYAASHLKLDIIKVLLETKVCDVNCRNRAGYTPIMLLALAEVETPEDQEIARLLFSLGDVNIKARTSGQTALMLAASHGRLNTCKLLLQCGADPSLQDHDGSTALMCGSELGNEEVVKYLLAHKLTDPSAVDNDGLDALTIAMNNGHKSIGLILYAAKNVPRMIRSSNKSLPQNGPSNSNYLGASLRRSRGKVAVNYVRRADSLLGPRSNKQSDSNSVSQ